MTNDEYHEGQEVVVITWCKAKIRHRAPQRRPRMGRSDAGELREWVVEFPSGMRAMVGADHLEPIQ